MKNFVMNEATDILVTKCFGQSIFLKKGIDIKTDFFLNPPEWRDGYMPGSELIYNENDKADDSGIFNFNKGDSLEYVFYRISADINDSFTGNSANLEMFYLNRVNIPVGDNKGNNSLYKNFNDFENKLCSSPMYIEYLTLAAFKNGRGNTPKITVKDLDLDTLTDTLIYFKQPDIMLYNGNYVLPRDIPPLLLLEMYKLFSKKLGARVMCFNSFTNSESPVANFINTALYNYRRDMVYLNFGSMIMSRYNTDYNLYADTAVKLYTDKYNIRLIFSEGALLSDLSDMRCIADEYSEEISEETYLPKKVIIEFFYNLSDYKRNYNKYFRPVTNRRFRTETRILALKSNKKTIYVYSEYSDYLRLNIEEGSSDCYLDRAVYIDRLPDRICNVSVVSLEEDEEKEAERKEREQRERQDRRIRAMSTVEEMKMERVPEDPEEFEPAEAFKLPPSADRPVNKLKDICALSQYSVIRSNTGRIHKANSEIENFTYNINHIISHDMKITNTEADYEMSDYLYDYSPSSYNYSLTGYPAIGEKTNYNHILIINNKVYADKNLSSMEFDMLLQTLKQPREFSLEELIYRAKLKRKNKDIFDAREKYIKQEFVPRTDSFHIQSITLELSNYKPLCVTTIMMEKTFSLSEYLYEVLGFFEKMPLTAEEYEAINNGSFKNLSLGDFKRYLFIYQCLSVLLNLYELLYIKICCVETDNLKCIGEIIDDKYFFDKRDENNKNNELVYSFGLKNTRFDFMLHHEYDLYKNFTYSTSEHCKDIESYTRPSYMKDLFLVLFGEADTPEGDNIKLKDFPKVCSAISFAHINPKNKYWYYKILLDSGMTGREIRERELLSFKLNKDLSCEDILNCLKDWFKEINKMLINTSEYPSSSAQYGLYSEIIDIIDEEKADLNRQADISAKK